MKYEKDLIKTEEIYRISDPESCEEKGILKVSIYVSGHKDYIANKMWKPGNYHIKICNTEESAIKYIME